MLLQRRHRAERTRVVEAHHRVRHDALLEQPVHLRHGDFKLTGTVRPADDLKIRMRRQRVAEALYAVHAGLGGSVLDQHDLRGIAHIHQVLRAEHTRAIVVGRDRARDQIRIADLRVDDHDRHARLLHLAECRLDLAVIHRIKHQQVDTFMQQIPDFFVLPLLIECRIARQQNIAAAFDHQPQFFIDDAVKRVVHRHVRRADAERQVRPPAAAPLPQGLVLCATISRLSFSS